MSMVAVRLLTRLFENHRSANIPPSRSFLTATRREHELFLDPTVLEELARMIE
jgi:hypothetical protein